MVAELALTIVLLVGAASMVRSFMTLYFVDLGFPIDRLVTMRVQLPEAKYRTAEARRGLFAQLEPRLAAIPGVDGVSVTTGVPPLDGGERLLEIDGAGRSSDPPVFVGTVAIDPRFFGVVGVHVLRGRNFTDRDGAPGEETVIVNERLATQFFPGEDPIGRRLRFGRRDAPAGTSAPDVWRTIVGVSPTIRQGSPTDEYLNAVVYIPLRQESPAAASLLIRSALPPGSIIDSVRREVRAIDQDQPVLGVQTVSQLLAQDRWWYRTWGGLFGILAALALLLSCVGLYAVMACSVTERTQEIGVRLALGAQRRQVSWLILERGLWQLAVGLALGFAGSLGLTRVLPGGLVSMTPHERSGELLDLRRLLEAAIVPLLDEQPADSRYLQFVARLPRSRARARPDLRKHRRRIRRECHAGSACASTRLWKRFPLHSGHTGSRSRSTRCCTRSPTTGTKPRTECPTSSRGICSSTTSSWTSRASCALPLPSNATERLTLTLTGTNRSPT